MRTMKFLLYFALTLCVFLYNVECQIDRAAVKATYDLDNGESDLGIKKDYVGEDRKEPTADNNKVNGSDEVVTRQIIGDTECSSDTNNKISVDASGFHQNQWHDNENTIRVKNRRMVSKKKTPTVEICQLCLCKQSLSLEIPFLISCYHLEEKLDVAQIQWPFNMKGSNITLTFQGLGLTTVQQLPANPNIVQINFNDNLITNICPGALSTLVNLTVLSLKKNQLEKITPDMFKGLKKVEELDLSFNRLEDFGSSDFTELISLRKLFLKQNLLQVLPTNILNNIPSLEYLDCSYNEIHKLNTNTETNFISKLKFLDLSYNKLTIIYTNNFSRALSLYSLDISNNNITNIISNLFQSEFEKLEILNVSNNHLSDFNFKQPLYSIKVLDFSFNHLEKVPENFNKKVLPLINDLYIDGNPLKKLIFTGKIVLRNLSAKNLDYIESLDEMSFKNVDGRLQPIKNNSKEVSCVNVAVSQCGNLKTIPEKTFQDVPLCYLDISYNQLRNISNNIADWEKIPGGVNLQGNPWDCECYMQWFIDDLLRKLFNENPSLLPELRCDTPSFFRGMRLVHFYKWKLTAFCNNNLQQRPAYMLSDEEYSETLGANTIGLLITIIVFGSLVVILTIYILIKERRNFGHKGRLQLQKRRQSMTDAQKMNQSSDENKTLIAP